MWIFCFASLHANTDWLGFSYIDFNNLQGKNLPQVYRVYFNTVLSAWLKFSYVYEGVVKHERISRNGILIEEYTHSFLILVSERSFQDSRLVNKECSNGWRVSMRCKEDEFFPLSIKEMDCRELVEDVFGARAAWYHPAYRVLFILPKPELSEFSFKLRKNTQIYYNQVKSS